MRPLLSYSMLAYILYIEPKSLFLMYRIYGFAFLIKMSEVKLIFLALSCYNEVKMRLLAFGKSLYVLRIF